MKIMIMITGLLLVAYLIVRWCGTPELRRHIGVPFLLSYFVPMYVSVITQSAMLCLVFVLIMFLVTTRDRVDAACRFVMLALLLPPLTWQVSAGPLYLFDMDEMNTLSLALVLKCLFSSDRKVRPLRGLTVEDAFVGWLILISWFGGERLSSVTDFARAGLDQCLVVLILYLALRQSIRSSEEFMRMAACLAAGAFMVAVLAIYEGLHGWSLFALWHDNITDVKGNVILMSRGGALRAPATMTGALMLGSVLLIGISATLYSHQYLRRPWMIVGWAGIMALGMFMAQSRGNMVLLPFVVLVFCVLRRRWGYAAIITLGAPAALAILLAAAPLSPRIAALTHFGGLSASTSDDGSGGGDIDYRELLLRRGLEEGAKNMWTGTSLNKVVDQLSDITQGQGIVDLVNIYLTLYLVSGLLGFVPFMLLLIGVVVKLARRTYNLRSPTLNDTRALALTTLATIMLQISFMSMMDRVPFCLVFPLAAARLVGIERSRLRRAPPARARSSNAPPRLAAEFPPRRGPAGFGAPVADPA